MRTKITYAAVAISILVAFSPATGAGTGFPADELDSFIGEFLDWYAIPGLSVAVVQDNEIVFARGYGVADVDTGEKVTPHTLYSTASVTKLFVGAAVMQLVEKGVVKLDAPVVTYLPYFRMKDDRCKSITVRHMLSHTSGMPDMEGEEIYASWRSPEYDDDALERYVRGLGDIPLSAAPGEAYMYSSMAFDVLGDMVAKVSGMAFEDYVQRNILDPLAMERSTILYQAADSALLASPHLMNADLAYEVSDFFPYSRRHPACGTLFSSVLDMSRWAMANNNRGALDGNRILRESSYDVMWTPAVREDNPVGIAWLLEEFGLYKVYSHGGGDPGFRTEFDILPDKGAAVVVMANSWDEDINPVAIKALNLLVGEHETDWFANFRGTIWKSLREDGVDAAIIECRRLTREHGEDNFHPAILNQIGNRLDEVDRTEDASRLFELNVEYYPRIYQLYNILAGVYLKLDRKDLAIDIYQISLEVKPDNKEAVSALETLRSSDE
jgi:CubicO group peptidase (beta-lactamase class C family)